MIHETSPTWRASRPPCRATNELEELGERIAELSALISAATFHLLTLIREFDERCGWGCGFKSCAHWLSWRTGIALGPAREKVRVARALPDLPRISAATRRGEISYSKVRALSRIATPENEGRLLAFAMAGTASHVERLVRAWRKVDRLQDPGGEAERHAARYLKTYVDEDGMVVVRGRLDPEVGAVFQRALAAASEVLHAEKDRRPPMPVTVLVEQRRADAVGRLAEAALAGGLDQGTRGDRYQVVVHVDAEVLAHSASTAEAKDVSAETSDRPAGALGLPGRTEPGDTEGVSTGTPSSLPSPPDPHAAQNERSEDAPTEMCCPVRGRLEPCVAEIEDSGDASAETSRPSANAQERTRPPRLSAIEHVGSVPAETSRRLACDAARVVMTHDAEGGVLDVGRRTRAISPALRRALIYRDSGCRFPGCGVEFCDAHHVEHWADGGETKLSNLVLLCRRHHRFLHEEGYRIDVAAQGEIRFLTPDGREIPAAPAAPAPARKLTDVATAIASVQGWLTEAGADVDWSDHFPEWDGGRLDLHYAIGVMWSSRRDQGEEVN